MRVCWFPSLQRGPDALTVSFTGTSGEEKNKGKIIVLIAEREPFTLRTLLCSTAQSEDASTALWPPVLLRLRSEFFDVTHSVWTLWAQVREYMACHMSSLIKAGPEGRVP